MPTDSNKRIGFELLYFLFYFPSTSFFSHFTKALAHNRLVRFLMVFLHRQPVKHKAVSWASDPDT